jgi:hypothetical protein
MTTALAFLAALLAIAWGLTLAAALSDWIEGKPS